jgi:hypothetical protein
VQHVHKLSVNHNVSSPLARDDNMAKQAAQDASLNVDYVGPFRLRNGEVADGCHANSSGE